MTRREAERELKAVGLKVGAVREPPLHALRIWGEAGGRYVDRIKTGAVPLAFEVKPCQQIDSRLAGIRKYLTRTLTDD